MSCSFIYTWPCLLWQSFSAFFAQLIYWIRELVQYCRCDMIGWIKELQSLVPWTPWLNHISNPHQHLASYFTWSWSFCFGFDNTHFLLIMVMFSTYFGDNLIIALMNNIQYSLKRIVHKGQCPKFWWLLIDRCKWRLPC